MTSASSSRSQNSALLPDGLPHTNPCLSFWLQNVRNDSLLDHRSTDRLPPSVDVVIIGSGICGALTAQGLLSKSNKPTVLCLEARETCSGATGRNAGHCRPDIWRGFGRYSKAFGQKAALEILEDERLAFTVLCNYIIRHRVDCDFWYGKAYDVPIEEDASKELAGIWREFSEAGGKTESVEFFDNPQTAAKISRIKEAKSLYVYRGATLFPWKLVAHVLRDALHKGLNLQTTTPATEVRPGQKGTWDVVTPRGIINCKQVVHATNAYSAVLLPEFRNIIHPTPHLVHRVIPPTSFSGSKVLDASYHVICSDHAIHSVNARSTSDGSILFGGANPGYQNLRDWVASDRQNMLNDNIASWHSIRKEVIDMSSKQLWPEVDMTPQKAQQIYVSSWSGILARSVDGMPFIGPVPGKSGQFACIGHNGHGMARMFTCAEGLVAMMDGASFESTGLPSVYKLDEERLKRVSELKEIMPIH